MNKLFHKLTRSWRGYHLGVGSSKILFSKGIRTSPRKSLRPNMSECQTVSHNVLVSRPLRLIWNWNMVAYRPSSNSHAGNNGGGGGGASKNIYVLEIWKWNVNLTFNVSLNSGFSVCFFTFVFRFPLFDLSGNKYTFTYLKEFVCG